MRRAAALCLAASLLALSAAPTAVAQTAEPFTYEDLITLDRVSDPRVSPDSKWALYSVRATDLEANRGVNSLWIADLSGEAAPRRLAISDEGANTGRWGSDGMIYFLSGRSGSSQVWRADAAGETATQVTSLPLDVQAFRLSPDADRVAVSLSVYPRCDTLQCSIDQAERAAERQATGQVYDRMFVRHWDTWGDGTQNHLFALPITNGVASGDPVWVTQGFDGDTPSKPFGDESEFTFTPDGEAIVFAAREAGQSEPWSTDFDLYRASATATGERRNLTEANEAWDTGPVFSPDGKTLAYRVMKRPGFEADRFAVMLRDVATGETRELAADWDRSADSLQWAPDGRSVYVTANDIGQTRIFQLPLDGGDPVAITGPGHVGGYDLSDSGFVFAQDRLDAPADLYVKTFRGREMARQITDHNASRLDDKVFGEFEQFSFPGWNGETVYGYVIKPANYVEGREYPTAFLIHGGPQGSFGNSWSYRWNPSSYAGAGYAVVMIDFHGSVGYGQAFTDSISQHWGDRPLEDLQKGWDYVQQTYDFVDEDRACALGASYGGYMINWIAGKWPNEFDCLVNHDGVFDIRGMAYGTEELWFTEWEYGGTHYENPEGYEEFNPVHHVQNWKTPMLVVQGDRDFRIPTSQGLSTFTALQRQGIESRLIVFPDENHWVLKPQNSLQWHNEVFGWLDDHIGRGAE